MLIALIKQNINKLNKYKKIFKYCLLSLATLLLLIPSTTEFKLMSFESCYEALKNKDEDFLLSKGREFNYKTPSETILLITDDVKYYSHKISLLKIRSKYVKVVKEDNMRGNYFLKIFINNSNHSYVNINIWSFKMISEIYFLIRGFFTIKYDFNPLNAVNVWDNRIYIHLSKIDINLFLYFIRICLNFHSHYYGLYFYTPFYNYIITADKFGLFCGIICLLSIIDIDLSVEPIHLVVIFILFNISPFTLFLFLSKKYRGYCGFLYFTLNLNYGFIYNFICYFLYLYNECFNKIL